MSAPSFDPDDPRLTAYALGESDDAERQAVEEILATSPAAEQEVERTRAFVRTLVEEYDLQREIYLAARPASGRPANVVAFPKAKSRWRGTAAVAWKIAAGFALIGSLVYLLERRPQPPPASVALSRSSGQPTPLPTASSRFDDRDRADSESSLPAAPPPADAAKDKQAMLAKEDSPAITASGGASARAAATPGHDEMESAAQATDSLALAKPSDPGIASSTVRRDRSRPQAAAAPAAQPVSAPERQTAGPIIRVRTSQGIFSGGVVLSSDGLLLASRTFSESEAREQCSVFLADGRELTATVERLPSGLCRLRVDATGLSPATLAAKAPTADSRLRVALVDSKSGAIRYVAARAQSAGVQMDELPRATEDACFALDSEGALLAASTQMQTRAAAKSTASLDDAALNRFFVRAYTPAEQGALRQHTGKTQP